jgi:hypothetical protein
MGTTTTNEKQNGLPCAIHWPFDSEGKAKDSDISIESATD